MIIQIAGTSGSGKSHLMRAFLDWARKRGKVLDGAGGYELFLSDELSYEPDAEVLGRYDVPTGGCDTISDVSKIYSLIDDALDNCGCVVFEGLFVMNQTRGPQLAARLGKDYHVLQLTTPLATCLASINERRAARGAGELANKKNTTDNYKRAQNFCARMREVGARVHRVSRDEGLDKILELLGVD